jgi:hypothetical protein
MHVKGLIAQGVAWHHVTDLNIIVKLTAEVPANRLTPQL